MISAWVGAQYVDGRSNAYGDAKAAIWVPAAPRGVAGMIALDCFRRLSHLEVVPKRVPVRGAIELALDVISVIAAEPGPRRHAVRRRRRVETMRHADTHDVTDQIPVVKIIPEIDL